MISSPVRSDFRFGAVVGAAAASAALLAVSSAVSAWRSTAAAANEEGGASAPSRPPQSITEFEKEAQRVMSPSARLVSSYVSGDGSTSKACRTALDSIRLVPRILVGDGATASKGPTDNGTDGNGDEAKPAVVAAANASRTVFGETLKLPVLVAPTSHHGFYTPDDSGEAATARGTGLAGAGYCYNWLLADRHYSSVLAEPPHLPAVVAAKQAPAPPPKKWLHLYLNRDKEMISKILELAGTEAGGKNDYSAIVLTCDHPHDRVQMQMGRIFRPLMKSFGFWLETWRKLDVPLYGNQGEVGGDASTMRDIIRYMMFTKSKKSSSSENVGEEEEVRNSSSPVPGAGGPSSSWLSLDWASIRWIKERTVLPVVVKGVLSPRDALLALEAGADGIVVSNHGGRQVDGAVPAIDALPSIVKVVNGRVPVFVDSGFRSSTDVIRAMCLGATAVLLGRPPLWALACGGADGLKTMLDALREDIEADMMSLGVSSLDQLGSDLIWPPDRERIESVVRSCCGK